MPNHSDSRMVQEYLKQTQTDFSGSEKSPRFVVRRSPAGSKRVLRIGLLAIAVLVALLLLLPPFGELQVQMQADADSIQLTWNLFDTPGVSYRVEKKHAQEDTWYVLADNLRANIYTDHNAGSTDTVDYRVSVCKFGHAFISVQKSHMGQDQSVAALSTPIPTQTPAPATPTPASSTQTPAATSTPVPTYTPAPTTRVTITSLSAEVYPINVYLSWSAPNVSAATFHVYRREFGSAADAWQLLASTKEKSYRDKNFTAGSSYIYKVTAAVDGVDHDAQQIEVSIPAQATPTPAPTPTPTPAPTKAPEINVHAGDRFFFGSYEQDNNEKNGREPIEWLILSVDKSSSTVMALARYCLDVEPYHWSTQETTWARSHMRDWLNNNFYSIAFTSAERKSLVQTNVDGSKDYVFLLDAAEANTYLYNKKCYATGYAQRRGIFITDREKLVSYWLRASTTTTNGVYVSAYGDIKNNNRVNVKDNGIRPAITLPFSFFVGK